MEVCEKYLKIYKKNYSDLDVKRENPLPEENYLQCDEFYVSGAHAYQ